MREVLAKAEGIEGFTADDLLNVVRIRVGADVPTLHDAPIDMLRDFYKNTATWVAEASRINKAFEDEN